MRHKPDLHIHWSGCLPVNPVEISLGMGITVYQDPNLDCLGQAKYCKAHGLHIVVRSNLDSQTQRLVVAHALGQIKLGLIYARDGDHTRIVENDILTSTKSLRARIVNLFVRKLLVPPSVLQWSIGREGIKTVQELALRFDISIAAMQQSLRDQRII